MAARRSYLQSFNNDVLSQAGMLDGGCVELELPFYGWAKGPGGTAQKQPGAAVPQVYLPRRSDPLPKAGAVLDRPRVGLILLINLINGSWLWRYTKAMKKLWPEQCREKGCVLRTIRRRVKRTMPMHRLESLCRRCQELVKPEPDARQGGGRLNAASPPRPPGSPGSSSFWRGPARPMACWTRPPRPWWAPIYSTPCALTSCWPGAGKKVFPVPKQEMGNEI